MDTEAEILPEEGEAPDAVETEEGAEDTDGEPEGDAEETEGEEKIEEDAEDEIELDLGGTKAKFKKGETVEAAAERLQKFASDLYSGVNRKFEEAAQQRKALEARDEALSLMEQLGNDFYKDFGRAQTIEEELVRLNTIDWRSLWQQSPDQARQLSDLVSQKRQELERITQTLQTKAGEAKSKRQQYIESVAAQGREKVEKAIPGFSDTHAKEVIDYAKSVGIPKEDAENWALSPEVSIMAWKAMMFDKAAKTAAKPQQPKKVDKPVVAMKARGTGKPDARALYSDKVSTEEWMKMRNKQLANRNR